jgi:transcription-repair coupling factor (superfamily II helicase)
MNKSERFSPTDPLAGLFRGRSSLTLGGVPDGLEGRILGRLAEAEGTVIFIARDARRLAAAEATLAFFAPSVPTLGFPAWDSLPYDRVSPNAEVSAKRMSTLHELLQPHKGARVLFTTANAVVQRVPDRASVAERAWAAAAGNVVAMDRLTKWLETNGFDRASTVREIGEYALRGGIVDLWAPGTPSPFRLDFFGDTLETIRPFDPATQRTTGQVPRLDLVPASEAILTEETIGRFRGNYRAAFGAVTGGDPLYEAVSEGRRFAGMEHWLPFFYERLETLFDYLPGAPVVIDHLVDETVADRLAQVRDHYEARRDAAGKGLGAGSAPYKPVPPDALYFTSEGWRSLLADVPHARLTPFASRKRVGRRSISAAAPVGRSRRSAPPGTSTSSTRWSSTSLLCGKRAAGRCSPPGAKGPRSPRPGAADHGLAALKPREPSPTASSAAGPTGLAVLRWNPASKRRTLASSATRTFWATASSAAPASASAPPPR